MMDLQYIVWGAVVASADSGGGSLVSPEPGMMVWTTINFLILLALLWKLAWKPLMTALDKREQAVRASVAAAQEAKDLAEAQRTEQEEVLRQARADAAKLVDQGRSEAQRVREDLVVKARAEADELVARARRQIDSERAQAVTQVREVAADLAIAAAERLLETALDDARHRKVVEQYIASLPETL